MIGELSAVSWCVFVGGLFVASLYIWWKDRYGSIESDPVIARHRTISVCGASVVSVILLRILCAKYELAAGSAEFLSFMGVRPGLSMLSSCAVVAALTLIMFVGPLVMNIVNGYTIIDKYSYRTISYFSKDFLAALPQIAHELKDSRMFWASIVVGPITEEIVYRACMCPVLKAAGFGNLFCCMIPPLCFGFAHLHHFVHNVQVMPLSQAVFTTVLQLSYTTVFGAFSCFVYLRTGHLAACITTHTICNAFGFPDFETLAEHEHRTPLLIVFITGVVLFFSLLFPLTDPSLFSSSMW